MLLALPAPPNPHRCYRVLRSPILCHPSHLRRPCPLSLQIPQINDVARRRGTVAHAPLPRLHRLPAARRALPSTLGACTDSEEKPHALVSRRCHEMSAAQVSLFPALRCVSIANRQLLSRAAASASRKHDKEPLRMRVGVKGLPAASPRGFERGCCTSEPCTKPALLPRTLESQYKVGTGLLQLTGAVQ